ncbi:MAG: phage holin family protein [Gemmatimonadota bacterium]|nr:phage holin family protein [Gemmatimonadota bacterium]
MQQESRGIATLLRELAEASGALVRAEARLARLEIAAMLHGVGMGTAQVAAGAVMALLGGLALVTGVVLLVGDQWLRDRYWLAALLATVILGGVAFALMRRGQSLLSPDRLLPDQTMATLKEDKEWLKQRLTSGATSS